MLRDQGVDFGHSYAAASKNKIRLNQKQLADILGGSTRGSKNRNNLLSMKHETMGLFGAERTSSRGFHSVHALDGLTHYTPVK